MKKVTNLHSSESDQEMRDLLDGVPPRDKPSAEIEAAVYGEFARQWREQQARRQRFKRLASMSVAASVLLSVATLIVFRSTELPTPPGALGVIVKQAGTYQIMGEDGGVQPNPTARPEIFAGQTIATGKHSGLAILWGNTISVRLDEKSALQVNSSGEAELTAGRIYLDIPIDLPEGSVAPEFTLATAFGPVSHAGTQFMVRVDDAAVQVSVREGKVYVGEGKASRAVAAGQRVLIDASGKTEHSTLAADHPDWLWTGKLTHGFQLDGSTVREFLNWVSRESGKQIVFDSVESEQTALTTVMHGNIEPDPLTSLDLVLPSTGMSWRETNGVIHISSQ